MSNQYAQLVERINRIVRDRGDVELMVLLDRIADKSTEAEQAASLGAVVKILNQNKKPTATGESVAQAPIQSTPLSSPVPTAPVVAVAPVQVAASAALQETPTDSDQNTSS